MLKILNKTRGWKLPLIALIGICFALTTVLSRKAEPAREPMVMPPISPYTNTVSGIGVIEPKSEVIAIGTELSGVVRNVYVQVGDRVKKDDPLFALDMREVDAQIKTLEATLEAAKVQAEDTAAQFNIVKSINDERAVARDDFNRRKFAAQLANARVLETQAQLNQALTTKDRMTVKSPMEAEILSVDIRAGEFATAGMTTPPLIRLGDTNTLHIRVEIDEENALRVQSKAPAFAIRRSRTEDKIPLEFVKFEPFIRPKQNLAVAGARVDTRVMQVIYALGKTEPAAMVGEQMDVFIETQK